MDSVSGVGLDSQPYQRRYRGHVRAAGPTANSLRRTLLSYRIENSGDGGVDLWFVHLDGRLTQVRNVTPRGEMVTLVEERYLRTH